MKTVHVSKFKAQCLGLLKEVRDTGESLAITLRGETLAIVRVPRIEDVGRKETVAETLRRLRPLLLVEDEDFEAPRRVAERPGAKPQGLGLTEGLSWNRKSEWLESGHETQGHKASMA